MDIITTHQNADFDCLGSMVAARRLYPGAAMVFSGAQERGVREFFLRGGVKSEDFLRLRDLDFAAVSRLILVDVREAKRIGSLSQIIEKGGVEVHVFDHHPDKPGIPGAQERIEPVGATVTVFTEIFREQGIVPTPEEATLMMLGLYEDTGSLTFNSTTVRDYQAAAFLLGHGANLNTVAESLVQELSAEQVEILHQLLRSRKAIAIDGAEISIAHASIDHFVGDLAVLAHKLKDMENLDALIIAVRMGERIFLVGRSRIAEVHVGDILGEFGGGGHSFAAAGTVREMTLVQVLERLPEILAKHVRSDRLVRDLMSSPVKTVNWEDSIAQVRHILTRYSINAIPVMEQGRVVGILTRQVVEKAAHHGLDQLPARELMNREFTVVAPDAAIETLQELVVEHNQRFVPVLAGDELIGCITRTDLLRHLVAGRRQQSPVLAEPASASLNLKKRQVARLLRSQLPERVTTVLRDMGAVGDELGVNIFAVGGFVRDLLLRQENLDIDLVVEGDGIAFAAAYASRHDCRIRTHNKFGTAVIIFPDGFKVDVASTRVEYYLEPGALPTVEHASIKHDLYRRDFTINTLAVSLNGPHYGELLDYFGGQRDLKDKAVRILHNLSFVEDPTRVFRAIRFEQRLGFHLGQHTEFLLRSAVRMGFLEKVGGRRVFNELTIILRETDPLPALLRMAELDLLKCIHPALAPGDETSALLAAASKVIHWFELLYTGESCEKWLVYFLCLVDDLDREAVAGACDRLEIPPRYREQLGEMRDTARSTLARFERRRRDVQPRSSDLFHRLEPFPIEVLLYMLAKAGNDQVRRWISHYFTQLRGVVAMLSGHDLRALGLAPGPHYKKILEMLRDARLNGRVVTRDDEIAWVRHRFPATPDPLG
ncbi:MAG: CBS domain-containing protein [Desulfuromonadales bacterium]